MVEKRLKAQIEFGPLYVEALYCMIVPPFLLHDIAKHCCAGCSFYCCRCCLHGRTSLLLIVGWVLHICHLPLWAGAFCLYFVLRRFGSATAVTCLVAENVIWRTHLTLIKNHAPEICNGGLYLFPSHVLGWSWMLPVFVPEVVNRQKRNLPVT